MRTLRGHSRNYSYVVVLICLGCLTFLSACGGSGGGSEGTAASGGTLEGGSSAPGTGSIVVNLEWEEPDSSGTSFTAQLSDIDVCIDYGIEEVSAVVRDAFGTIVASELWPCSAHVGTIEDVPAGSNISVVVEGLIESSPRWLGEIRGLVVRAGDTATTRKVEMKWIPPFPTDDPTVELMTPQDNETEVSVDVIITAKFSQEMVESTINSTTCTLSQENKNMSKEIPCNVVYDPDSFMLTMIPEESLLVSHIYSVNISSSDVEDKTGRNLTGDSQWKFRVITWYKDSDDDGYSDGKPALNETEQPDGYKLAVDLKSTAGDINDNDPDVYPGAPEICDGKDNDYNPATSDGASEVWIGDACDGNDKDMCKEGTFSCSGGIKSCSDNTSDNIEVCDGTDNDCNPATADGASEVWLGTACDGPDSDKCMEGTYSCSGGKQSCSDNTADNIEVCDGKDNDCNPATADGTSEAWLGTACDGSDSDKCMEGAYSCSGGKQSCSDNTSDNIEVCDGKDNDCNPATADGSAETWLGDACDGNDSDDCDEGILSCLNGEQYCSDETSDNIEIYCDEIDQDCDGSDLCIAESFDFEELTPTYVYEDDGSSRPGELTILIIEKPGNTITITREEGYEGGYRFDTVDNQSGGQISKPLAFGDISLDPFFDESYETAFIINFSIPVSSFQVDMGDYNTIIDVKPADDDTLVLEAFSLDNASGKLLDRDTFDLPDTPANGPTFSYESLFLATPIGECIRSVRMIGGSISYPHSVFYDNIILKPCGPAQ